jgi:hypothetical protein
MIWQCNQGVVRSKGVRSVTNSESTVCPPMQFN